MAKTQNKKKILLTTIPIILLIVTSSFILVAILQTLDKIAPTALENVEIREFQGQKLSSINDFRENSINGPQNIDILNYRLNITGLVETSKSHTYNEIISSNQLFEKVVTIHCVEGWSVKILWEGILVRDLISNLGIDSKVNVVIFYAHDGYSTSLPLEYILNNDIIMAYKMNGIILPPERGFPFQLVAEDKFGYKWIKWITEIELSDDTEYKGYWESRGYPNEANIPGT